MKDRLERLYNRIFHSSTMFKQLVIFTIIVSIIPIIFISVLLFRKLSTMVTDDLVNSHKQVVAQYMSNLEEEINHYGDSIDRIANNTIILNTLMDNTKEKNPYKKGQEVSIEVNKSLRLKNNDVLRNCMIYSNVETSLIYGNRVTMIDEAKKEAWYTDNHNFLERDYFIYSSNHKKSDVFSLIQEIVYVDTVSFQRNEIGLIKLDIDMNQIFKPVTKASEISSFYGVIVLDKEDNIIFSSNYDDNKIVSDLSYEDRHNDDIRYYNDMMVMSDSIEDYGLKLIFLFDNSTFSKRKTEVYQAILPIIFIIIVTIICTAYIFTRGISKRAATLVEKIKVAGTGDLSIDYEIDGNDEITILDKQFNHMLLKLDDLIKKNYIQRLENRETELRNLQLQINPHFLYNTLETISSIAAMKQAFNICELCQRLGNVFRYSLGKNMGEYVTVNQEIEHIQNYIYIQSTRFVNKFEVYYSVEPDIKEMRILRFILQPIVENAIVHGLSKKAGNGILEISVSQEYDQLFIRIEDDGVGMTASKVEELKQYINSDMDCNQKENSKQGIGIRNVNQRIKLSCGDEYGITLESMPQKGTCFTIKLPLISGGDFV
ncbi:MAG: histidine kinase [Clostridiales bacterium]|nr:histidine kinase [Clostridiales bacterium]